MATITHDMVKILNERLAGKGSVYRIVQSHEDYKDVEYNAILRLTKRSPLLRPYLVEEVEFTNLSSAEQEMNSTISKEIQETSEWHITAGLSIGLSVEAEAGVFFAKATTTMSAELSVEAGTRQIETTTVTVMKDIGLRIPSHTTTTLSAILEQEEARSLPFTIDCVVHRAPFKYYKLAPVYRFHHSKLHYHCYTTDSNEAEAWRQDPDLVAPPREYFLGYVYPVHEPDTVPVYRFLSIPNSDYVCTSDENEAQRLRGTPEFIEQNCLGFVYATAQPNTVQVRRFYNPNDGHHIYSTNPPEQEMILKSGNYVEETQYRFGYVYRDLREADPSEPDIATLLDENERSFQVHGEFTGTSVSSRVNVVTQEKSVSEAAPGIRPEEKTVGAISGGAPAPLAGGVDVYSSPEGETARTLHPV